MCLQGLLQTGGYGISVLTAYVFLDFLLSFSMETLVALNAMAVVWLAAVIALHAWKIAAISQRDTACQADQIAGDRRRSVLSAFELQSAGGASPGDIRTFLIAATLNEGCSRLEKTPLKSFFPSAAVLRQAKVFLFQAALAGILLGAAPAITGTVLERIFFPGHDSPPWSPFDFSVTPDHPKVLYGGTLELAVNISGKPVTSPVYLLTRRGGRVNRLACFQENSFRFTQHLENVTDSLEFCFSTGPARSPWRQIELLLQPKISLARIEILPPPYSLLPKREWMLGREELTALAGSRARLLVTSNRPLSTGVLTIAPSSGLGSEETVKGERSAMHTLAFAWEMNEPARLQVEICDIRQTPSADKLVLIQKILPDTPPQVSFSEPPGGFALATPRSIVPMAGQANDDFGLKEVRIVHSLLGYRDRLRRIGPETAEKTFDFCDPLNLGTLGVEEGQVLEIYLEAADSNPAMTGIGSSDILRIEVISDEEYAEILRSKITLEEFITRFQTVQFQLEALRKALREIQEESRKSGGDPRRLDERLKAAREAGQKTEELFARMAADFTLYEMEEELQKVLLSAASPMKAVNQELSQLTPANPSLGDKAGFLLESLGETRQAVTKEVADAKEVVTFVAVMQHTATFKDILKRQTELTRKLKRFESTLKKDPSVLPLFSGQQETIRSDLEKFSESLARAADQLPKTAEGRGLRQSALDFLQDILKLRIPVIMDLAVADGRNQNGLKMFQNASLALEKLESLLSEGCPNPDFNILCNNRLFKVRKEIAKTLRQMLSTLDGSGHQSGQSGSGSGDPSNGSSLNESTLLNTPAYGPMRGRIGAGIGPGGAGTGSRAVGVEPGARESLSPDGKSGEETGGYLPERIPEKYREAVKKYFSN
jgi:predicted  nucleic acid-binding Zn-ribbon protein